MAGSSNIYHSHQGFTALVSGLSWDHVQGSQYFPPSWQYQQDEAAHKQVHKEATWDSASLISFYLTFWILFWKSAIDLTPVK